MIRIVRINPRRVAATAPQLTDEQIAAREADRGLPSAVADMCHEWGRWVATRRVAAPRPLGSVLGRLRTISPTGTSDGPHLRLDADLAAFHMALQVQDERSQAVLYGLYALPLIAHCRVPAKQLAEQLGIGRATLYRVRNEAATLAFNGRNAVIEAQHQLLSGARDVDRMAD